MRQSNSPVGYRAVRLRYCKELERVEKRGVKERMQRERRRKVDRKRKMVVGYGGYGRESHD